MSTKGKRAPHHRPLPCVVLGVDLGKHSAWSGWVQGVYRGSGSLQWPDEPGDIVSHWYDLSDEYDLPLVLIGEDYRQLSRSWGEWKGACERQKRAKARRHQYKTARVLQQVWRSDVLGHGRAGAVASKRMAVDKATGLTGERIPLQDHNRAEAVCIGFWGCYARNVGDVLQKRVMRRWRDSLGIPGLRR